MTRQSSEESNVNVRGSNIDPFCERVNYAIKRAGGTTKAADKAGVSQSVIRKWRSGASDPSRSRLVKLAAAANLSVAWLAAGEGSPEPHVADTETAAVPIELEPVDLQVLELSIEMLEAALFEQHLKMQSKQKAELVSLYYSLLAAPDTRESNIKQIKAITEKTLALSHQIHEAD